ncbi:transposase, partial [mine drainage metagenome]
MRQTELSLNQRDRRVVDAFRSKGLHRAREFKRAHILAALDRQVPERQ